MSEVKIAASEKKFHHGLCYEIIYRPLQNIKLYRHLVRTGICFCFLVRQLCQGRVRKQTVDKILVEGNCRRLFVEQAQIDFLVSKMY